MAALVTLLLLSAAAGAAALRQTGSDVHCVGARAHALTYHIEGEANDGSSRDAIKSAEVSLQPLPSSDHLCAPPNRTWTFLGGVNNDSKAFCYGVNENPTCDAAKADLPLKDGIDCSDCFLGASTNLFYTFNYSIPDVNSVKVGLHDTHLRGAVQVHTNPSTSKTWAGTKTLKDSKPWTLIDKLIGCPVCVRVHVTAAVPTELDWSLTANGNLDVKAGVQLDVDLGDNYVSWDHKDGWQKESTKKSYSVLPNIAGTADAEVDLGLNLKSSLQLDIDKIIWFHVNVAPTVPINVKTHTKFLSRQVEICSSGTAGLTVSHEADLHVSIFGKDHDIKHFGPTQDFQRSLPFSKCVDVNDTAPAEFVV